MAKWIKCRSTGDPELDVYINLDHVTIISQSGKTSTVQIGENCEIVIPHSATAILLGEDIRPVW